MNAGTRIRNSMPLASQLIVVGLTGLFLAVTPTISHAAEGQKIGSEKSISGTALAESGGTLPGVVITLETLTGPRDADRVPPRGQLDGVTVINPRGQLDGVTVINRGGHFAPDLLVVPVGTTVTFRTGDRQLHTAELSNTGRLLSHLVLLADGPDFAYTFSTPGIITVMDWMNSGRDPAHIVVSETRYFDVSDDHGQFTIRGIPAGTYMLRAWHKDLGSRAFVVMVADANETQIAFVLEAPKIVKSLPTRPSVLPSAKAE